MEQHIVIIGSGFSGLSSACYLAKEGNKVTVVEKNANAGGRCSVIKELGFTFDMGPSWYWMPDVFDRFFADFGKHPSMYYDLKRLDPSYSVFFNKSFRVDMPADYDKLGSLLESIEKGAKKNLDAFMASASYKYHTGMGAFVEKPCLSIQEFTKLEYVSTAINLQLHTSVKNHIKQFFKHEYIHKLLEFPAYFLGALPQDTPALYTLMNYADIKLGTWYPMGGMYKIIEAMYDLCIELGVQFQFDTAVTSIDIKGNSILGVDTNQGYVPCNIVLASADYNHVEQKLLPEKYRQYTPSYWDKRVMAPSALVYYLGLNKKINNLEHHNLFFDESFEKFGSEIYNEKTWPDRPLFYACCPSKTDDSVAPPNNENLFLLIPVAAGLKDTDEIKERYFTYCIEKLESYCGEKITPHIIYKKSFAGSDFISRYNAFKGNAYGLSNVLSQTAVLKPSMKNPMISNLYYTGQLTVPGPGVPPSLISGKIAASLIKKEHKISKQLKLSEVI